MDKKKPKKVGKPALVPPAPRAESSDELDDILQRLDFQPEGIVQAASEQAILFKKAADYRVSKMRARLSSKARLEDAEAEKAQRLRKDARDTGEKTTEGAIEEAVRVDTLVQRLRQDYNDADAADEYSRLLLDALRMRRDCIEVIGQLAASGLHRMDVEAADMGRLQKVRDKLREKYVED